MAGVFHELRSSFEGALGALGRYALFAGRLAAETPRALLRFRLVVEQVHNAGALSLVIMDLSWCGGISEARRIASLASAWHTPVAFHDCSGPVVLAASTHLALATSNCFIQEMVRAFYFGWYPEVVEGLPMLDHGALGVSDAPGIGVELRPEVLARPDCHRRSSREGQQ